MLLWALKDGQRLCVSLNLRVVEIEVDARFVFYLITETYNSNLHHTSLIMDCKNLLHQPPKVKVKHYQLSC